MSSIKEMSFGLALGLAAACLTPSVESEAMASDFAPRPGQLFLYAERITLKDGGFAQAERGVLLAPVKRSSPESGVIGVEVYRFRASSSEATSRPAIFRLHGGPGWPGLSGSLERRGFYEENIQPLLEIADLVVVGQRGIGSSKPDTVCETPESLPIDREISEEEEAQRAAEASRRCRDYWLEQGLDLSGLNVVEAAADVRDAAKALGYDKIVIWGGSFGSHWGMGVMRFHPQIVARAVLTGMEGPDHTYDMPSGVLNSLKRIAAAAEKSPKFEGKIPDGGLISAFQEIIARVEKEPMVIEVNDKKVRFDADDVRGMALGFTSRASSRGGIRSWPADIIQLHAGDFKPAARVRIRRQLGGGFPTAAFFMLDCGSGISAERERQLNADPAAAIVGRLGRFYQLTCPSWESDLGEEFRRNFETDIPTVIVHGDWDTSTPYDNALELAPFFKNRKMVTVRGGSHGALEEAIDSSPEFRKALMAFVAEGDFTGLPDQVELPELDWNPPR